MAITGSLEETQLANLLHLLDSRRSSGKLTLSRYAGSAVVVLRRGKVIYAASNGARETLGHMLLCSGQVTVDQLRRALERQLASRSERRLGAILVSMGVVTQEVVDRLVREQIIKVISELLQWTNGFYRFEALDFPQSGEVEVDAVDFMFPEGLAAEGIFRHAADHETRRPDAEPAAPPATDVNLQPPPDSAQLGSLKSIVASLTAHEFFGELTLEILEYARGFVGRGVLFGAGRTAYRGMGQFGLVPPPGAPADFVRGVSVPSGPDSVLGQATARRTIWRGPLDRTAANGTLVRALGGEWPTEALTAPLLVSGRVLLVFYGDRLAGPPRAAELDRFELLLMHVGVAMERNLLAKRVRQLEQLRHELGTPAEPAPRTAPAGG